MNLSLFAGSANVPLAASVAAELGVSLGARVLARFADGELPVEVQASVRGRDVFLCQSTPSPVEAHLFELLLLADACQRAGADRLTAVIPYFGCARQDRRAIGREPVAARVAANVIRSSAMARVAAVDRHGAALEGVRPVPLEHLSAVDSLADAARATDGGDRVVVAPDLGASKLAAHDATRLDLPVAIVPKQRTGADAVTVRRITGKVRGCAPIVGDDISSTGGTIAAAVAGVLQAGALPEVTVVATHALLVGPALARLTQLPLRQLIVTDSVRLPERLPVPSDGVSLAPLLATVIARLHGDRSLAGLIARR